MTAAGERLLVPSVRPDNAWWVVALLHVAYLNSFLDRTILSLLVDPIKQDLGLSDTQMGFLQGLAFGLIYTVMGLPFGWAADRYSRRKIIAGGMTAWAIATSACGLATNYAQLFIARMSVGIGEATLNPSAISLIGDLLPQNKRALALGIYQMAASLGVGIALLAGGLITKAVVTMGAVTIPFFGTLEPWRLVMIIVGLPGVALALVILTIKEPARRHGAAGDGDAAASWAEFFSFMTARKYILSLHILSFSFFTIYAYGVLSWVPAFFMREFGWDAGAVGVRYGTLFLVFGTSGALLGGVAVTFLRERGRQDAEIFLMAVAFTIIGLLGVAAPLMRNEWLALLIFAPIAFFFAFPSGISLAFLQNQAPGRLHGRLAAVYYLVVNLLGSIVGTTFVGYSNDLFFSGEGLGQSLALLAFVTCPIAAGLAWMCRYLVLRRWLQERQFPGAPRP